MSSNSPMYRACSSSSRAYSPFNRAGRAPSPHSMIESPRSAILAAPRKVAHPNSVIANGFPSALPWATNADVVAEAHGDLRRTIAGVCRDDIERPPIDAIEGNRGVAHFSAEPRPDHLDGLAQ